MPLAVLCLGADTSSQCLSVLFERPNSPRQVQQVSQDRRSKPPQNPDPGACPRPRVGAEQRRAAAALRR